MRNPANTSNSYRTAQVDIRKLFSYLTKTLFSWVYGRKFGSQLNCVLVCVWVLALHLLQLLVIWALSERLRRRFTRSLSYSAWRACMAPTLLEILKQPRPVRLLGKCSKRSVRDSTVRSTSRSSKGPSIHVAAHNHLTQLEGIQCHLLTSVGTRHAHGEHTCKQNTNTYQNFN